MDVGVVDRESADARMLGRERGRRGGGECFAGGMGDPVGKMLSEVETTPLEVGRPSMLEEELEEVEGSGDRWCFLGVKERG